MKHPTVEELCAAFGTIDRKIASHMVHLCQYEATPEQLCEFIRKKKVLERTRNYAWSLPECPYETALGCRRLVLYSLNYLLGMRGARRWCAGYEYLDAGDPQALTLIYEESTDTLHIGCWADFLTVGPVRDLTEAEAVFEPSVEPELAPPEESELSADLRERIEQNDTTAWCILIVKARWRGFEGVATRGGYTFPAGRSGDMNEEYAKEAFDELRAQALADLNQTIRNAVSDLESLRG